MPLTDIKLKSAKPAEKPYKLFDGGGLFVLVNPTGSKLWKLKYRHLGKEKLLSFGGYPLIGLKKARELRNQAKQQLLDGFDPSRVKQELAIARNLGESSSFSAIAEEYVDKARKEGRAEITLKKLEWLVGYANASFGSEEIKEISAPKILSVLKELEAAEKYETAQRLRSTIGRVFRYAVATGRADQDPTYALQGALVVHKPTSHAAIVDEPTLGALMSDIARLDGYPVIRLGLQLLAMLAQRPGELRNAKWSEFDLGKAIWRIPAERMKMRRSHEVPLSTQAIERLKLLQEWKTQNDYLLPSISSSKMPISENTFNLALKRAGYSSQIMTPHGFRSTFSSLANEANLWNPDAIERHLAHADPNSVRRVYSRGSYWEERQRLVQWWSDKLDSFAHQEIANQFKNSNHG